MTVHPYKELKVDKKAQVALMFNNIAHRYDFLNHFLSLGIDRRWRKKAIRFMRSHAPKLILDIATGTGDFAIQAIDLKPDKIIGVDISTEMLRVGREKIAHKNLSNFIELREGDSEHLEFATDSFDAITVAFGVRNFANLEKGLKEMNRVLKRNGMVVILEFSHPQRFPVKQLYYFYFFRILPFFGRMVSKDKSAYSYLPESVKAFPSGDHFVKVMDEVGFIKMEKYPLSFGVSTIYVGYKL